jgi:hypothetical protein
VSNCAADLDHAIDRALPRHARACKHATGNLARPCALTRALPPAAQTLPRLAMRSRPNAAA